MRMKVAILALLVASFAYQFLLPLPSPGPEQVAAQVQEWTLQPEKRQWEAIRWTDDPALAFEQARKVGRPVLVFRSAAPFSRG